MVFDIGANAGFVSAELASVAGQVFAFEPNPDVIDWLRNHALPNVQIVQKAVSDRCGTATLHIDVREGTAAVASSLMHLSGMEDQTRPIEVETITVDAFAEATGFLPDLIKIDVEGFEPQVIAGARAVIERRRPIIIFELWEAQWENYRSMIETLSHLYYLVRVSNGEAAIPYYDASLRDGIDDILCIPRRAIAATS